MRNHLNLKYRKSENGQQIIFTVKNLINTGGSSTITVKTNTFCRFKIVQKSIKIDSSLTVTPPWRVTLLLFVFHSQKFV